MSADTALELDLVEQERSRNLFRALERPAGRGYVDAWLVRALFAQKGPGGKDLTTSEVREVLNQAGEQGPELTVEESEELPHAVPEEHRLTYEGFLERMVYRKNRMGAKRFTVFLHRLDKQVFEVTGVVTPALVAFTEDVDVLGPDGKLPRIPLKNVVHLLCRCWVAEYEEDGDDAQWAEAQRLRGQGELGAAIDLERSTLSAQAMCSSVCGHGWIQEPDVEKACWWQEKIVRQLSDGVDRPHLDVLEDATRLQIAQATLQQMKEGTYRY